MLSSAVIAAIALAAAQEPRDSLRWLRPHPVYDIESGGQHGIGLSGGVAMRRPPIPGPSSRGGRLALIGDYGITGSRSLALTFDAPGMWRDWRVYTTLRLQRMLRTPYLGPDNQAEVEDSLRDRYGTLYYRHALLRSTAYAVVQRRLAGALWLHAGGQLRHYRTSSLEETPTLHQQDMAAASLPDTARYRGSEARLGLVFDTRDDWIATHRGVMLEGIVAAGRLHGAAPAGSMSYLRYLWAAREFIPLDRDARTVLALRQRVALSSDTLPYFLAYEQLTSRAPSDGVLGRRSIRLHSGGTVLASNVAYLSADFRRIVVPPDWRERERRLWVLLLADAGVVWEPRQTPGDRRWHWTVGTGFRFQNGSFMTGGDIGITNEGFGLSLTSGFAF